MHTSKITSFDPPKGSVPSTLREAVIQVLHEMPDAMRQDQHVRFDELLALNPPLQFDAHARVFDIFVKDLRRTRTKASNDVADAERIRSRAEEYKGRIILLNLPMPNGKPMRDCLGSEMAVFGRAYAQIAAKVGERKVGDVLSEEQVRQLIEKGKH